MKPVPNANDGHKGLTLIEITLVIAVLLTLISVLYLGVNQFKKGSNRALCIQNLVKIQQATRAYCNMNDLDPGDSVSNLDDKVVNNPGFFPKTPTCPGGGTYSYKAGAVPAVGTSFATCSLVDHIPSKTESW